MSTLQADDLAQQIAELQNDLRNAEAARVSDADRHAQELREQLRRKEQELREAQSVEAQEEQDRQHAMQLTLLQELGVKESAAKAEVLQLQRELATLPQRLQMAQAQHSEICRLRARLKTELGI
jgi:hypothetical protein